ncbi:MAG: hypothetical protein A2Y62_19365 [Candidatus Fischerbacteria bacterium RBG_13_37_8]|uniref:GTP pyrophosphokinase n=1 Tax=Candidatus Fischerbacteria bacterium RBG_13_37_8 TaxID=1817863 RepID=A0A1F5VXI4_9BACT|nr:MAG: hypothetical protein A2Y62_19365 [Candidatus Fischerbacteria bacterium RBG_13_37_8]
MKELLQKALEIAMKAHEGQVDKVGLPYFLHVVAVSEMGKTLEQKIVGLLHDVIEDSSWTLNDLKKLGFPEEILDAIDRLTKRKNESIKDYLSRVKGSRLSLEVKLNDLSHNMDISRISNPAEKDFKRIEKYKSQKKELEEALSHGE